LEREANDPDSPIAFDKELNEFNFEYSTAGTERKAQWRIYHCPFCGGAAPESKRRALFASISDAEERRLRAFVEDLQTVEDVIKVLGAPDQDRAEGRGVRRPEGLGTPPTREWFRVLAYARLSDTADLRIVDYPSGRIGIEVAGKYIGKLSSSGP
jgi:hypothetical protein